MFLITWTLMTASERKTEKPARKEKGLSTFDKVGIAVAVVTYVVVMVVLGCCGLL